MKVVCPHCNAAYNIDDRRVPAAGLKVRCPKCRDTFPVRGDGPQAAPHGAVPLPAPPGGAAPPAQGLEPPPVPLPGPVAGAAAGAPLAPPAHMAAAPARPPGVVPLPAPTVGPDVPFAFGPPPAPAAAMEPLPVEPVVPGATVPLPAPARPTAAPPALSAGPSEALSFGEIDFAVPPPPSSTAAPPERGPQPAPAAPVQPAPGPAAAAAPPPDPFVSGGAPPPVPSADDELEMLFGDGAGAPKTPGTPPAGAVAYKVRRRSGKIFGPFDEAQIREMLSKGELLGNEDVSADDGATWSAIGGVAAFADALAKAGAAPAERKASVATDVQRVVPFGDRMAGSPVVEGPVVSIPWRKVAAIAAAILLVVAVGAGSAFTPWGFLFVKAFRRGDAAKVAALVAEARRALDRAEYPADRAALDAASRAVAADGDSAEAAALHAMVVATLELRHGAPTEALEQARRSADRLEARGKGTLPALAARLAVTLASAPGEDTLAGETALEQAAAKAAPDSEVLALLGRSALARGDAPRAAGLFARLEAVRPGTPRAGHGVGLAYLARRDVAGATGAFQKVLASSPAHLPSRLELAAIAESAGDVAGAEAQLAPLLAAEAEAQLAPAERARALALKGALLARVTARAAEADRTLEAATQADPRLAEARLALARHRLRHGDAAGAVGALDPLAAQAVRTPAVAALRIRALATAGRALDASSLADQALGRSPGDPALLLAKAAALASAGKQDEATALYRDAAARDPAAVEPRLALGRIALGRRELAEARVQLAAAAERGPREPAAQAGLAELAVAEGNGSAAEKGFQAALSLDPEYTPAEIGLAKLALARGDAAVARVRLERALAIDPRSPEAHLAHGTLLWRAKDLAGAERALQAAVDLQPRSVRALCRLGAVKLERGADLDGAVRRLTAASNEDPKDPESRQWLGRALLAKGEMQGAIAQLRRAVDLEPANAEHHLHLGAALEQSGAVVEAIDEYRAAASADPKYVDAHERLGLVLSSNGRFGEAAAAYEKAIAAAPKVSRLRVALADCKARLGKHDDALRIYREVLKADSGARQVPYKVARALHEAEGAKAALPWYERAARDENENPMPHYYLGYLYKERGQKAKAVGEFKRFLALKPDADERKDIESEIEDLK